MTVTVTYGLSPKTPNFAAMYSLIITAKLNDVDPRAWLADVLARLPDYRANSIADLLPWNWQAAKSEHG